MKVIQTIRRSAYCLFMLSLVVALNSCKKLIEVDSPVKQLASTIVFNSDGTAEATIIDVYGKFGSQSYFGGGWTYSVTYYGTTLADEMNYYGYNQGGAYEFFQGATLANNGAVASFWNACYSFIYSVNATMEGLKTSTNVSAGMKTRLTGEAKFFRALCHFYLVSFFGDVPYVDTTDYKKNSLITRMPAAEVYQKVIADLTDAANDLSDNYVTAGRARVNKWVATAFLARAYLYAGEWAKAEQTATTVIDHTAKYALTPLNDVFLTNSREAIWQLPREGVTPYASDGQLFNITSTPYYVALTNNFLAAFEPGDNRKSNWVNSIAVNSATYYFPYKYKEYYDHATGKEGSIVLRLAEQYLIRAEARARQNKLTGANSAETDINTIRNRAGLTNTTATTQQALLDAILQERKVELFSEWGHRWFDLKRFNKSDAVLGPIKPGWTSNKVLWPIPQSELMRNPKLTQNQGY